MIIFELILTTFKLSILLEAAETVLKISWVKNQTNIGKFSLPESVKRSVVIFLIQ